MGGSVWHMPTTPNGETSSRNCRKSSYSSSWSKPCRGTYLPVCKNLTATHCCVNRAVFTACISRLSADRNESCCAPVVLRRQGRTFGLRRLQSSIPPVAREPYLIALGLVPLLLLI